jgi:hypothetical protein
MTDTNVTYVVDGRDTTGAELEEMPSKGAEAVRDLYLSWTAARIRGEEQDDEHWGDAPARRARTLEHRDRRATRRNGSDRQEPRRQPEGSQARST